MLVMLNPFAPHITEELFEEMGFGSPITSQSWVTYDPEKCVDATRRDRRPALRQGPRPHPGPGRYRGGRRDCAGQTGPEDRLRHRSKTIVKEIYVKGKLVNIVAK